MEWSAFPDVFLYPLVDIREVTEGEYPGTDRELIELHPVDAVKSEQVRLLFKVDA